MNIYYLEWSYGFHHKRIKVNKNDFFMVINDLSKEFLIIKDIDLCFTFYSIINYDQDKERIGYIYNTK